MCSLERAVRDSGLKFRNFPVFFPVSREFSGEGLAQDCTLRHTVWVAEKPGSIPLRIAGNRRNSVIPSLKPDRRKCPAEHRRQAMERFSLEGPCTVRFPRLHQANAMRSATDDSPYWSASVGKPVGPPTEGMTSEQEKKTQAAVMEKMRKSPIMIAAVRREGFGSVSRGLVIPLLRLVARAF